jgi:transposase, IS5 family
MLRTRAVEVSLWEAVLLDEVLRLPEELARLDALLDDPSFFAPFVPFFDPRLGRPSTPMEVYLRLMFLKFRYRLGYESLCREVTDSIRWRRFCRITLDGRVPHPTTDEADHPLRNRGRGRLQRGVAGQGHRGEAAAHHPAARGHHGGAGGRGLPDRSGLLAKAVRRIAAAGRRVRAAGGATRTRLRDRSRSAGRRAREIGAKLRLRAAQTRDEAQTAVRRITGELAGLAERSAAEAEKLLVNARRAPPRPAAPGGQRPDRPAGRDPPDRRPDPPTPSRHHPGRGDPAGQPARRRCPPDRQRPARPAGGVRATRPR